MATASPDTSARTAEAKTLRLAVLMYLVVFTVKLITYLATGMRALFAEALLIAPQWGSINRRFVGRLRRGQLCDAYRDEDLRRPVTAPAGPERVEVMR